VGEPEEVACRTSRTYRSAPTRLPHSRAKRWSQVHPPGSSSSRRRLIDVLRLRVAGEHSPVRIDFFDAVISIVEVVGGGRRGRICSRGERLLDAAAKQIVFEANGVSL